MQHVSLASSGFELWIQVGKDALAALLRALDWAWGSYVDRFPNYPPNVHATYIVTTFISFACVCANIAFRGSLKSVLLALRNGDLSLDCCFSALAVTLTSTFLYLYLSGDKLGFWNTLRLQSAPPPYKLSTLELWLEFGVALIVGLYGIGRILRTSREPEPLRAWGLNFLIGVALTMPFVLVVLFLANHGVWDFMNLDLVDGLSLGWAVLLPALMVGIIRFIQLSIRYLKGDKLGKFRRRVVAGTAFAFAFASLLYSSAFAEIGILHNAYDYRVDCNKCGPLNVIIAREAKHEAARIRVRAGTNNGCDVAIRV